MNVNILISQRPLGCRQVNISQRLCLSPEVGKTRTGCQNCTCSENFTYHCHRSIELYSIFLQNKLTLPIIWGRKVIGISGSLILSKTLMELIFNLCREFRCEVQRTQLAKSTLLTFTPVPLGSFHIFQSLFRC